MRKRATEIVVGVVLLSPGRGRERTQPTRGSATYSHFTEPQMAAKHGPAPARTGLSCYSHRAETTQEFEHYRNIHMVNIMTVSPWVQSKKIN